MEALVNFRQTCAIWLGILSSLLMGFSCEGPSQRATEVFTDGKIPKLLEMAVNPRLSPEQERAVISAQQQNSNKIRVAVIDSGIDYLHPALINRTAFHVQGGQIVGAGLMWPLAIIGRTPT